MTDIPGNQTPPIDPSQTFAPPTPPYAPVVDLPKKKSLSTLKIVLIIVGTCVGLGFIGVGVVGYGVYKTVIVPSNSSQPITESDLGVAIYPGAEQTKGSVRMAIAGKSEVTDPFLSSDSKDQVIAFYQSKLGPFAQIKTSNDRETLSLAKGSGEVVIVTVAQRPNQFNGKTQIVIMHAKNTASSNSN